jgi:reverse gyrase
MKIARTVEEKRAGLFKAEPLQSLIVAQMILKTDQFSFSLIPPGSGKTFIIMLLALYYSDQYNSSIFILTSNSFLEAHLDSELKPYLKNI